MGSVKKCWDKFFFEPISPASLGLFRIVFGFVVFLSNLGRYPIRELFYLDSGVVKYHSLDKFFPDFPLLYFRWLPQTSIGLQIFFIALLIVSLLFMFGLFTRVTSVLLFFGVLVLSNRNFFVDNAGDHLLRINLFFLMFSHCGDAYSLDRWIARKRGKATKELVPSPPWAQRMIQLQLSYLYIDTVYLKLQGHLWLNGTAMYYALNYVELKRFDFKYLFYFMWQIKLMTYFTLVGETLLGTLIWLRKFRYYILALGLLLHLGINLAMQFPIFQYVMIASLITFIYPEDVERLFKKKTSVPID